MYMIYFKAKEKIDRLYKLNKIKKVFKLTCSWNLDVNL